MDDKLFAVQDPRGGRIRHERIARSRKQACDDFAAGTGVPWKHWYGLGYRVIEVLVVPARAHRAAAEGE